MRFVFSSIILIVLLYSCAPQPIAKSEASVQQNRDFPDLDEKADSALCFLVARDITIRQYFPYIDSIVAQFDSVADYPLTEHILVRANDWIIDTLASFDYYKMMERGIFVYDQRDLVVLKKGDSINIPNSQEATDIQRRLNNTVIDVNIPEYKLRIIEMDSVKHTFTVRVGRNESKYLKTAKRTVSLQTPIGEGEIVRIERNPIFVNPVNGERYNTTKRDDGEYTAMPQIPWMEPAIGGRRLGSLIHPTTNPNTLGKAYSNGCVGTGEGDAWIIYYHSPVGTKVKFRYDLEVINEDGERIELKDIYDFKKAMRHSSTASVEYEESELQLPFEKPDVHEIGECH